MLAIVEGRSYNSATLVREYFGLTTKEVFEFLRDAGHAEMQKIADQIIKEYHKQGKKVTLL